MTTVDRAPAAEQPPEPPPGAGWSETWMGGSPEAERRILARALPGIEHIQDVVARRQKTEIRRAFHNKGTVVAIQFDVAPDLPPHLRAPFLEPRASFPGFARFSRSQSVRQRDRDRDQRGFAFRIETPAGAQDILLSNTPTSFARDPVQFLKVTTAFAEGPLALAVVKVILALGVPEGVRVLRDLLRAPDRTISFTTQRYWSRTAFQLGEVAIRLFVRPLAQARRITTTDDPDFLTTDLARELRETAATFELCAQHFVDEERTPIEDTSRIWDEAVSPPVRLGTVTILRQELDGDAGRELAERVERLEAFNPIVTPGLRPLGRMNRARVLAYERSAAHRRARPRRG